MGYKQLLQVHDELILEGPEQFADEVCLISYAYKYILI